MSQPSPAWPFQSAFGPHFGLAWDITGKGTTVIRAGSYVGYQEPTLQELIGTSLAASTVALDAAPTGALLYEPGGTTVGSPLLSGTIQGPGTITDAVRNFSPVTTSGVATSNLILWNTNTSSSRTRHWWCGNGLGSVSPTTAATGPGGANPVNPAPCNADGVHFPKFPMYIGWNINIQHAFTNNLSLDVGYVGSLMTDETATYDINEPLPGVTGATAELLRRPFNQNCPAPYGLGLNPSMCYPWFAKILLEAPVGSDHYNGLQMNLTERVSHGLNLSANFTLHRAYGIVVANGLGGGLALELLKPEARYWPLLPGRQQALHANCKLCHPGTKGASADARGLGTQRLA